MFAVQECLLSRFCCIYFYPFVYDVFNVLHYGHMQMLSVELPCHFNFTTNKRIQQILIKFCSNGIVNPFFLCVHLILIKYGIISQQLLVRTSVIWVEYIIQFSWLRGVAYLRKENLCYFASGNWHYLRIATAMPLQLYTLWERLVIAQGENSIKKFFTPIGVVFHIPAANVTLVKSIVHQKIITCTVWTKNQPILNNMTLTLQTHLLY